MKFLDRLRRVAGVVIVDERDDFDPLGDATERAGNPLQIAAPVHDLFPPGRRDFLNAELFADLREAKALAAVWQNDYNHRRPHSALAYQTPAAYAATCELAAAAAALGAPPQTPPGALPLDPGFFPSTERGEPEMEIEDPTLITVGT